MGDVCLVDKIDGIMTVTLNRPKVHNALNQELASALDDAFGDFELDPGLRVAIITGAGGTFCSGMDLKAFAKGESSGVGKGGLMRFLSQAPSKPVIAAVEGYARAGGVECALTCDIVVASKTASFAIAEVKRGLVATGGAAFKLPRKIPHNIAMEILLTGDPIGAERAAQLGLVNHLTEPGHALAEARRIAARIAENAPLALALTKKIALAQQDLTLEEGMRLNAEVRRQILASEDAREGAIAFAEKRKPVWKGR